MKLSRRVVVSGLFLVCAAQVQCTLGPGLSTPDQRAKVVALTRSLERDPLGENVPATRQWLRKWIIEVPDIRVYACDDLLGRGLGDNYPYSTEVKLQPIFSAAAFAIDHRDKARDEHAQHYAGVEGALRVYEALLKSKPDARSALLDDLLAKRDHGELADHVAKLAKAKCKRSNFILIANLVGTGVALVLGLLVAWGLEDDRPLVLPAPEVSRAKTIAQGLQPFFNAWCLSAQVTMCCRHSASYP